MRLFRDGSDLGAGFGAAADAFDFSGMGAGASGGGPADVVPGPGAPREPHGFEAVEGADAAAAACVEPPLETPQIVFQTIYW